MDKINYIIKVEYLSKKYYRFFTICNNDGIYKYKMDDNSEITCSVKNQKILDIHLSDILISEFFYPTNIKIKCYVNDILILEKVPSDKKYIHNIIDIFEDIIQGLRTNFYINSIKDDF